IREGVLEGAAYQYEDRKDYQYLRIGRDLYQYNIKRYKLSKIPTLRLAASYNKQAQENAIKYTNWYTASYVALRLSVPIFNGFATNAKIAQARLTVEQMNNQLDNMKLTIDRDVDVAKNNFKTAISAMDFQKKNMQLATSVYDQTKKKQEVG